MYFGPYSRPWSSINPQITTFAFARMAELEEGSGTEASDAELLEQFDSIQPEDYASESGEKHERKSKTNYRSCVVYRRGQKQLTRLFLREVEHLLELSAKEQS